MSPQTQGTTQDEQAIRRVAAEFVGAWNKNDAKALAACFSSDGDLINPAGRVARNRSEIEKLLTDEQNGLFKGSRITMPQKHLRFLKPDIALADYEFEISHMRGADGKESSMRGLVSSLFRKDGESWLIAACRPYVAASLPGSQR